ncbi:tape measure protein [Cupriavidus sp. D384]|uniref:tape measure protein n=1 Tax=Cupriavidus sp. D384 TaxID=1538095 RepID=UPI00083421C8|nr:tape measure protein [Cupriavidus sp. D384]
MNAIRELVTVLRYKVDNSDLRKYQAAARQVAARARAAARTVTEFGAGFAQGARQGLRDVLSGQQALNRAQRRGVETAREMRQGYTQIAGLVRTIVAGMSVMSATRIADEWAGVEGRVALSTDSVAERKAALKEIYAIAQRTRQAYAATGDLFQKVQRNAGPLGLQLTDSLGLTEIIGKAMTIGGGDAGSQQAALLQLGQALGAGSLRGDELNSIIEQAPRLALAIADAFGVTVGELRDLGKAGRLTSRELAAGLLRQANKINAEFERMPKTFGGAMVVLKNAVGRQIAALNRATGAARRFSTAVEWLARNLAEVLKLVVLIGASTGLVVMRRRILAATTATRLLQAAMIRLRTISMAALWPFLRMAALLASIYLIGQDIWVWLQGGDSVIGDLLGPAEQWHDTFERIRQAVDAIKDALGGAGEQLAPWLAKWGTVATLVVGLAKPLFAVFRLIFGIGKGIFWLVRGAAMLVAGLAAIVGWPAVLIAAAIAAVIALGVYIYKHWEDIKAWAGEVWDSAKASMKSFYDQALNWIKGIGKAISDWIGERIAGVRIPNWMRRAASWVAGGTPITSPGTIQRQSHGAAGGTTVNQTNHVTVNAANAEPAAVAAATQRGMDRASRGGRAPLPPGVEAAA